MTFKQTDPLYVINLSDPAKPAVLGAIKVPGFSNYLQAADTTGAKLIGFGRDADVASDGSVTVKGLKLSLYDFTDLAKPRELDSYFLGDASSNSIALSDHKAFLYSVSKKLLVIPAVLYAGGQINFAGALAFTLDNDHFTLKGRVDHSAGGASEPDYWNGYDYYDNTVKRSLYINDALYTFSNKFLKINNLTDLSEIKTVSLLPSDYSVTSGAGSPSAGSSGAGVSTPGSSSVGSGPLGGASPLPAAGAGLNGLVSSPDAGSTPASAPPIVNPPANQSTSTNGTSTGPTPPSP